MNKSLFAYIMLGLLFSSCASILNTKRQKITITTNDKDAVIYLNNEKIASGRTNQVKIERGYQAHQLRVETDKHLPENVVLSPYKRSPIYVLNWIPFGPPTMFMAPFYDIGKKAYNFDKEVKVTLRNKKPQKTDDQKYLFLKKAGFSIDKEDLVFKQQSIQRYYNLKDVKKSKTEVAEEDIDIDNSIFTDKINDLLKDFGYVDTTKKILKVRTNSMYLAAEVSKATSYIVDNPKRYGNAFNFYMIEAKIDWDLQDVYGQSKYKKTITSKSGEFTPGIYDKDAEIKAFTAAVEDALTKSLLEFLSESEVKGLLKIEETKEKEFDFLSLKRSSSNVITDLDQAKSATVTVKVDEGHGSGLAVSNDGYIITNYHVVAGQNDVKIVTSDKQEMAAEVVRFNDFTDLALLKVDYQFDYVFDIPQQENYKTGEEVFAIGTPSSVELGQTLSKGIISGYRDIEEYKLIQTDASVSPGNSGGPLVSRNGALLGVVSSKVFGLGVEGISFCIPAKDIQRQLSVRQ